MGWEPTEEERKGLFPASLSVCTIGAKKFLKSEMHSLPHYVVHYRHRDIVGWIKVFNEPCVVFHMGASPRDEYLFGTIGSFVGFRFLEFIIVHHQ